MAEAFVGTFRAHIVADDEVDANLIFDELREVMMRDLDEDDGDFVVVTQVIPFSPAHLRTPQEVCDVLRRDRNLLIATRYKEMWDVARSLDQTIHLLMSGGDQLINYDYSRFLEIAADVLAGKNPVE